jgi:hypothetical protein
MLKAVTTQIHKSGEKKKVRIFRVSQKENDLLENRKLMKMVVHHQGISV